MYLDKAKPYKDIFFSYGDDDELEGIVEDDALAMLLLAGHLFVFSAYMRRENPDNPAEVDKVAGMHVNCNDLFWWACADSEPLPVDEIGNLYKLCFDEDGNPKQYGSTVWACLQRKMRPQHPLEEMMRKDDAWTDELEALPVRKNTG